MPFKSEKQRKWMHANKPKMAKKWEKEKKDEAAERDYKDEYKKFQSSTKAKKYRAELNKYNRKKGTYGNGDGKDASHKGGKIVGFEAQSKNRGRAEKSRLKKEQSVNELVPNMAVVNQPAYKQMLDKRIGDTKVKTALANKDHKDHKKAKSIAQRVKDKIKDMMGKKKDDKSKKSAPKKQTKQDADFYKRQFTGEAKTINVEPNWEGLYKFMMHMRKTDMQAYVRVTDKMGRDWKKLVAMAKKHKWTESVNEEVLNEATYVHGKMLTILRNSFNQVHTSLTLNVTQSNSMDDNQQSRLTMFKRRMDAARNKYIQEVVRATKPFDKEITGV